MKPNPLSSSNHLTLPNAISSPLENDYSSPARTSRGEPTIKEREPGNESADANRNGARRPRERRALTAALTHYPVRTCVSTDLFFLQHLEFWHYHFGTKAAGLEVCRLTELHLGWSCASL